MTIEVGDQFELFGTGNIFEITGEAATGHWIVDIKQGLNALDCICGVLVPRGTLSDGIADGKLIPQ